MTHDANQDNADFTPAERARIDMTLRCRDCDHLPKVTGAGDVIERDGIARQRMHNGLLVKAGGYHGAWMVEIIRRLRGHHEPQEEAVFSELLGRCTPGGCMVELGAFWSYYAAWFVSTVPGGRAVLLEPDAGNLAVGRDTFSANGLTGEFHLGAVTAEEVAALEFERESDGERVAVPGISVTGLVERSGVDRVELLLADVQGAELAALEGSRPLIDAGRLRFSVISTHHHSISGDPLTHQRCLEWIRSHDGHVIAEHTVAESYSGDGLVVASFSPEDRHLPEVELSRNRAADSLFRETEYDLADAWEALRSSSS